MKYNLRFVFIFLLFRIMMCKGQVGVGTNIPHTSAIFEIKSNSKGFLMPRMNEISMNDIVNPKKGLLVYCYDCMPKGVFIYNDPFFKNILDKSPHNILNFPSNYSFYKRSKTTNSKSFDISGHISNQSGITYIVLDTYKNDVLINTVTKNFSGQGENGFFHFSFPTTIPAELGSFKLVLKTNNNIVLKEASNFKVGDIYILQGQSNAVGLGSKRIKNIIQSNENIPVLVLSQSVKGKSIIYFQRDDMDKYNKTTNYGLLLNHFKNLRYKPTDVTAIIWFQGEQDSNNSLIYYISQFTELYNDWEEDYDPDHYYVFQTHGGCNAPKDTQIPEAHRQLQDLVPNLTTISNNGVLKGTDECHYGKNGYDELTERLYSLLSYNFYNSGIDSGIYSPNVSNVKFGNLGKTTITFNLLPATDTFTFGSGVENDFFIENSTVTVTSVSISGNLVTLNLSGPITESNAKLTYLATIQGTTQYIFNQNNIGMLNFKDILINDF